MKGLRSDNGTEYTSHEFKNFTREKGIIHEFSSPYIHEQNSRVERDIRTVVQSARSILLCRDVDKKLWPEAVNTACYTLNRVVMQHLKSSLELNRKLSIYGRFIQKPF